MDMNVSTSAIDKGIGAIKKHCRIIREVTSNFKHNMVLLQSEYDDDNYREALKIVENVDRSILSLEIRAEEVQRNMNKLKRHIDDYNETGYRG